MAHSSGRQGRPLDHHHGRRLAAITAEICHGDYVRIEARDQGGPWNRRPSRDGRAHGLDIIAKLAASHAADSYSWRWGPGTDDVSVVTADLAGRIAFMMAGGVPGTGPWRACADAAKS